MLECRKCHRTKNPSGTPIISLFNGGLCSVCYDPSKEEFLTHQAAQRSNRVMKGWKQCGRKKVPFETAARRADRLKKEA